MDSSNDIERRLADLERKLDNVLRRLSTEPERDSKTQKPQATGRGRRIFWGLFIVIIGLIWLGQNYNVQWLSDLKLWPVALIAFGVYFMLKV